MRFEIEWDEEALEELGRLRAYDRQRIVDAIETHLILAPDELQGPVKYIDTLIPPWSEAPGIWQLSVVPFRIFYDVFRDERRVCVQAVRRKPHGKQTKDIL